MLTQCPHCLTLFRVGPEHLKAAAGQVRCCRCHQVFNALQRLQESPTSFTNPLDPSPEQSQTHTAEAHPDTPTAPVEERLRGDANNDGRSDILHFSETNTQRDKIQAQDDGLDQSTEPTQEGLPFEEDKALWPEFADQPDDNGFSPMLPGHEPTGNPDGLIEGILEQDNGLDPEPDYFAADSESQMSELLDQDSSSILLPDTESPTEEPQDSTDDNIFTFSSSAESPPSMEEMLYDPNDDDSILKDEASDEERDKPDYDSVPAFRAEARASREPPTIDDHAFNFEAETSSRKPRSIRSLLWFLGSLLLLLPLAGQLAWQFRGDLIQHDAGRQSLYLLCRIVGCEVPIRQALDKIIIQGRNLSTRSDKPNTLFLQVNIINTAAFQQPFPRLILSLYNDKGDLVARRTFLAKDYLPPEFAGQGFMPMNQPILVEMELVDPGKEVTGFSFDFF